MILQVKSEELDPQKSRAYGLEDECFLFLGGDKWLLCLLPNTMKMILRKNPDPSYGNTRPSDWDTPGATKQVST